MDSTVSTESSEPQFSSRVTQGHQVGFIQEIRAVYHRKPTYVIQVSNFLMLMSCHFLIVV